MAVVQLGNGSVPRSPPAVVSDVVGAAVITNSLEPTGTVSGTMFSATSGYIGGVISGYALSGGSTHVGAFWPMQAGSTAITTDGTGQAAITFPYAFANTPTAVVATVDGSDYAARIVSKSTTSFTVKILQGGVNWTSGSAVTSVSTGTGSTTGIASTASDYAATTSGGVAGDNFLAVKTTAGFTAVTSVTTGTSVFPVSVSGFLTALPNTGVTVDWIGAA